MILCTANAKMRLSLMSVIQFFGKIFITFDFISSFRVWSKNDAEFSTYFMQLQPQICGGFSSLTFFSQFLFANRTAGFILRLSYKLIVSGSTGFYLGFSE